MTRATLAHFQTAMQRLQMINHIAVAHMGRVKKPDTLVQIADFFLKLAEALWSVASGVSGDRLIVVIRNAGFRRNAGRMAREVFGDVGSAGGHRDSARAEIPLGKIACGSDPDADCRRFVMQRIKSGAWGV